MHIIIPELFVILGDISKNLDDKKDNYYGYS